MTQSPYHPPTHRLQQERLRWLCHSLLAPCVREHNVTLRDGTLRVRQIRFRDGLELPHDVAFPLPQYGLFLFLLNLYTLD